MKWRMTAKVREGEGAGFIDHFRIQIREAEGGVYMDHFQIQVETATSRTPFV